MLTSQTNENTGQRVTSQGGQYKNTDRLEAKEVNDIQTERLT